MSRTILLQPFPWTRYSKKLAARIETPRWFGTFNPREGARLVTGSSGSIEMGNFIKLHWLVDLTDGMILDAKYQLYGQSALIGAAETACELIVGKNYDQAQRIGADLIDKHLRDHANEPSFPFETSGHLNLVIDAIEEAGAQCGDIPLSETYVTPIGPEIKALEGGYPGYLDMPEPKQHALIEGVIASDIRPYIELDAGGIDILKIIDSREIIIAYSGTCTSCAASTGTTLSYIQQVLRAKVHPEIIVVPDMVEQKV